MRNTFGSILVLVAFLGLFGCGGSNSPALVRLKSPDPGERQDAADDLREGGGPTREAASALFEAIKTEPDPHAQGAMLISIGASGLAEAEPLICERIYASDARMRSWAKRAQKLFLERNRQAKGCPPPGSAPANANANDAPPTAIEPQGVTVGPMK